MSAGRPTIPSRSRATAAIVVAFALALLLSALPLGSGGRSDAAAAPGGPTPPPGQFSAAGDPGPLPPEARAALDEFLRVNGDATSSTASELPPNDVSAAQGPRQVQVDVVTGYAPLIAQVKPTATATPVPYDPADIVVTALVRPSVIVERNGTLAVQLVVRNIGLGRATRVDATLPWDAANLALTNAAFYRQGDYVSQRSANSVTASFADFIPGESRSGTLYFQVNGGLPNSTVLNLRAFYTFRDRREGGGQAGNWTPVLVGPGNQSSPYQWLSAEPRSGFRGTTFSFYTDRFLPFEGASAWLNTPTGVLGLPLQGEVDGGGRITLQWSSGNLAPATYQMVVFGRRSRLTAVQNFTVQ